LIATLQNEVFVLKQEKQVLIQEVIISLFVIYFRLGDKIERQGQGRIAIQFLTFGGTY